MNVHEITLDVSKEPAHEPSLYIAQGDKNGTTLKVNVYDNGQALTLTSYTVSFCMRSPDAQDYYEVAGTVSGNVATFLIDETYAAGHPGITEIAYINIINGTSNITSSSRLRVVVLPSAKDGVVPAPAYVSEIDQFIEESQERVDEIIEEAEEIIEHGIPLMSATTRGGAKLGTGLEVDANEKLNVTKATTSALGAVKPDGSTITIDNDGTIHGSSSYSLPTMSSSTKGGAKLGNGLSVDGSDKLNLSPATTSAIGGVKADGTSITVDNDGKIHAPYTYTLPAATTSTLGGVKADGSTITVDNDGTIHGASTYTLPPATTSTLGGVKADGSTITVDNDGTIHSAGSVSLPTMSPTTKGGAKLGDGLSVDANDKLNLGSLVKHSSDGTTDGSAIYGVTGEGFAHQDGTPTPDYPQEIRVARGKNLLDESKFIENKYIDADGTLGDSSSGSSVSDFVSVEPGQTLTASAVCVNTGPLGSVSFYASKEYTSASFVSRVLTSGTAVGQRYSSVVTVPNGAKYAVFNVPGPREQAQLELGSQATIYIPYGCIELETLIHITPTLSQGYFAFADGQRNTSSERYVCTEKLPCVGGFLCAASHSYVSGSLHGFVFWDADGGFISAAIGVYTTKAPENAKYMAYNIEVTLNGGSIRPSDVTDLDIRQTTTTPIPLPAKGFAASISRGSTVYKDALSIDSAGRFEWGNQCGIYADLGDLTWAASSTVSDLYLATMPNYLYAFNELIPAMCDSATFLGTSTGSAASFASDGDGTFRLYVNPNQPSGTSREIYVKALGYASAAAFKTAMSGSQLLYPLNTPTTESGYIDLPALPSGATVTIPELDNVGVDYWVHGAGEVVEHVSNVYKRVEAALAEIATS